MDGYGQITNWDRNGIVGGVSDFRAFFACRCCRAPLKEGCGNVISNSVSTQAKQEGARHYESRLIILESSTFHLPLHYDNGFLTFHFYLFVQPSPGRTIHRDGKYIVNLYEMALRLY